MPYTMSAEMAWLLDERIHTLKWTRAIDDLDERVFWIAVAGALARLLRREMEL